MRFLIQGYRRLLTHPRYGIWVVFASLLYLISPIDLSPDLLPVLGQIDDVALIALMIAAASQWLGQQFLNQEQAQSNANSQETDETIQRTVDVDAIEVEG